MKANRLLSGYRYMVPFSGRSEDPDDHRGIADDACSLDALSDAGPQLTQCYYPYGANRGSAQSDLTERRYTGQYQETGLAGIEGLYYYNARWYDAGIGRFTQADTIVPSPANPQALNRYAYVYNNPLKYADSSGRVPVPLITGGVGALVASAVDLVQQLAWDRVAWQDLNWAEVCGAAAGGFVAGATMGLATPGTSMLGLSLLGGVGSVAGGQVGAIAEAGVEQLVSTPDTSLLQNAQALGFLDAETVLIDAGTGIVVGGVGSKFSGWLRSSLRIPERASTIRMSGGVPMARWSPQLKAWTIRMEGRTVVMDADIFERIVRTTILTGYGSAEEMLKEAVSQGTVRFFESEGR